MYDNKFCDIINELDYVMIDTLHNDVKLNDRELQSLLVQLYRTKIIVDKEPKNIMKHKFKFSDIFNKNDFESYINSIIVFINSDKKIQKQIEMSCVKDEINKYIADKTKFVLNRYNKNIFDYIDAYIKDDLLFLKAICDEIQEFTCIIMDVYCLARMFKQISRLKILLCIVGKYTF